MQQLLLAIYHPIKEPHKKIRNKYCEQFYLFFSSLSEILWQATHNSHIIGKCIYEMVFIIEIGKAFELWTARSEQRESYI